MEKTLNTRLGFGLMRLPLCENGEIDYDMGTKMVDYALQNGITYFDTAWIYHSGESENFIGKALCQRHPRESFMLADKMPIWLLKTQEQVEEIFYKQLEKCQTEYFDYYLVHSISEDSWGNVDKFKVVDFLRTMQREGKIKKLGFSFHGGTELLKEVLAYADFDFVQLQINYYDMSKESYAAQYNIVRQADKPIIIMEPVRGGFLAKTVPEALKIIQKEYGENGAPKLALSYADGLNGVMLVLSGMSNMGQMVENIDTFKNPILINEHSKAVIDKVLSEINRFKTVDCTKCEYCLPCPVGIEIPRVFEILNRYELFSDKGALKESLAELAVKPDACIDCGKCHKACPQNLLIPQLMKEFSQTIAKL